jgi:LuxR family transcriptional regulator, quorum-sensing system regulator CviR
MRLSNYLSKKEAFTILELVSTSQSCAGEQDFHRLMRRMRALLPYESALCAHAKQGPRREMVYDIMSIRYPSGELPAYAVDRWRRTGPSPKAERDIVLMNQWKDVLEQMVPISVSLPSSTGSRLNNACVRTVCDTAGKGGSLFSLSGKRIRGSRRTATIMDIMTPHLHIALARSVYDDKSEWPSCSVLSPREKAVLAWLRRGKSTFDTAEIMDISERTVKYHISNIMQKLGASNRAHAVSIAIEQGILDFR